MYDLLKLKPGASSSEIRKAYRHAALAAHPDKGGTTQSFHVVKLAFEVLSSLAPQAPHKPTSARQANRCCHQVRSSAFTQNRCKTRRGRPANRVVTRIPPKIYKHHFPKRAQPHMFSMFRALENMRKILQSMSAAQRLASIQRVDPEAKVELLSYMTKYPKLAPTKTNGDRQRTYFYDRSKASVHTSALSNVRAITSTLGARYKAHLVIRGLRLYADATNYETAINQHIIFLQMRDAVFAASSDNSSIWEDPASLLRTFSRVLDDNETSEAELGLHVFVYMRAAPWLDKKTFITSPVMELREAVTLYSRLLCAQKSSWSELRTEWIALLQCTRGGRKRLSKAEAEKIVDSARGNALEQQFDRAAQGLKRAIHRKTLNQNAAHLHASHMRKHSEVNTQKIALERKGENHGLKAWRLRRYGLKGKDLTMEHFLRRAH